MNLMMNIKTNPLNYCVNTYLRNQIIYMKYDRISKDLYIRNRKKFVEQM